MNDTLENIILIFVELLIILGAIVMAISIPIGLPLQILFGLFVGVTANILCVVIVSI